MSLDRYYTLRWREGGFRTEECLAAAEDIVRIGEEEHCDVKLVNPGEYQDEVFCIIKPSQSSEGWVLIPVSDFVTTFVNGSPVKLIHYLENGDKISFSETGAELAFEIRHDNKYADAPGTHRFSTLSRRFMVAASLAAVLLFILSLYAVFSQDLSDRKTKAALENASHSVLRIRVDSIYLVKHAPGVSDTLRRMAAQESGSAFYTDEGILVTARHCIEPWLNNGFFGNQLSDYSQLPDHLAWALEAETWNQTSTCDTSLRLISKCSLLSETGQLLWSCFSSDFRYDNARDEIIELGDFAHEYYWRSVTGRFNRTDMMLGDIAVLEGFIQKGTIALASQEVLDRWLKAGTRLIFYGYPTGHKFSGKKIDRSSGEIKTDYSPGEMLAHNGELGVGYSGGPALIVHKGKVYAVGVISTYDETGSTRIYSVPVSEAPLNLSR